MIKLQLKTFLLFAIYGLSYGVCYSQNAKVPKLVVGVVIDQMRAEYLYRFQDNYTENGFKRLMREGFNVKNVHYNYIPTATGPGHASIFTGTTPANHGVVSNDWYSRKLARKTYCAEDSTVFLVDINKEASSFSRSPKNLLTSTITDELKLYSNGRSKVIGLSLKDRGAIFPAGHMANAAYWYNGNTGNFVTSTYYRTELPVWLKEFNARKKADSLLNLTWEPMLPIEKYVNSELDNTSFEKIFIGRKQSTFPYNLKSIRNENGNHALITEVPQGNTLLTELVKATIKGEELGQGKELDFLTISYSSTDYVGHHFGIRSKELEDTYVRMDREIEMLLNTLDNEIGKGNYTLFLTADHAASDHPSFLKSKGLPGEFYSPKKIKEKLNSHLSEKFGKNNYIEYMDKTQIYLAETNVSIQVILEDILAFLVSVEGVKEVFAPELKTQTLNNSTLSKFVRNSYHSTASGNVFYHMASGWMEERSFGTTHGNAYTSDTHVPLLWYGANIPQGSTARPKNITQITATLSMLLNLPLPSACNKNPIEELFEKYKN